MTYRIPIILLTSILSFVVHAQENTEVDVLGDPQNDLPPAFDSKSPVSVPAPNKPDQRVQSLSAFNSTGVGSIYSLSQSQFNLELGEDKKRASIKLEGYQLSERWRTSLEIAGSFDSNSETSAVATDDGLSNATTATFGLDYLRLNDLKKGATYDRLSSRQDKLCKDFGVEGRCSADRVGPEAKKHFETMGLAGLCKQIGLTDCSEPKTIFNQAGEVFKSAVKQCQALELEELCTVEAAKASLQERCCSASEDKIKSIKLKFEVCPSAQKDSECVSTVKKKYTDRVKYERKMCSRFNVEGQCKLDSFIKNVKEVFQNERTLIGRKMLVAHVVPIRLTVGRETYKYRDPTAIVDTDREVSDEKDLYGVSVAYGLLYQNWFLGAGIRWEESYKTQPSRQLCQPTGSPEDGLECVTAVFGPPTSKDTHKIFVEARKRFGLDKAVGLRIENDEESDKVNVEIPFYFITSKNGLSAGLKLNWDEKNKETQASLFIGTPFEFY